MRAYFKFFDNSGSNSSYASNVTLEQISDMEENFTSRYCPVPVTDNDTFAFTILSETFRDKLKQMKRNGSIISEQ